MARHDSSAYCDPLDVLRRFIPTPLRAVYHIDGIRVMVQTNDFSLLPTLPSETTLDGTGEWDLEWKLVRDIDSHGALKEPLSLRTLFLTVVEMGTGCLLGMDHERRELLAFIGADVDTSTYQGFLVPFFRRMTNELLADDRPFVQITSKQKCYDA